MCSSGQSGCSTVEITGFITYWPRHTCCSSISTSLSPPSPPYQMELSPHDPSSGPTLSDYTPGTPSPNPCSISLILLSLNGLEGWYPSRGCLSCTAPWSSGPGIAPKRLNGLWVRGWRCGKPRRGGVGFWAWSCLPFLPRSVTSCLAVQITQTLSAWPASPTYYMPPLSLFGSDKISRCPCHTSTAW